MLLTDYIIERAEGHVAANWGPDAPRYKVLDHLLAVKQYDAAEKYASRYTRRELGFEVA